ncbi:MAG: PDZ domain-containing protein [Oscillospiraceae bacterium]|nr:PDZ domain-containing protein [Oscillospiraceae bacterium]
MKKKISLGAALSLLALTAAVTFILTLIFSRAVFHKELKQIERLGDKFERLNELDETVQREFYTDIPEDDVIDGMLAGYISGLGDQYSVYRSEKELSAYQDSTAGVYTGIGIGVQQQDDGMILIASVTEGGSAEKAGIQVGDFLIEVEGINASEHYQEAVEAVRGEADTYANLRIKKGDTGIEQSLSVKRAQIDEITIHSEMLENQIGYIRISKFRTVSAEQFETARQELLEQGAKGFIFDVRNNGGGVLAALEKMVDPMLPEGDLAFAYDKEGNATTILHSDKNELQMPYLVLVNGSSASASELFACVMRDYAGAKLVGTQTFGKGIMQTTFQLSGGGVTLTTATYATGKTPCYHGVGLTPDIISELDENAVQDTQLEDAIAEMNDIIAAKAAA